MDLGNYVQQDTSDINLVFTTGEKLDVTFTLAGPTHPIRKALENRNFGRFTRDFNKKGKAVLDEDAEDHEEKVTERLVKCTLGWKNLAIDGKAYDFSAQAAHDLYTPGTAINKTAETNFRFLWVRMFVLAKLDEMENFTRSSSAS